MFICVGPVNAELDIVTHSKNRASRNLLILAAIGWRGGGASAQWPAAFFLCEGDCAESRVQQQ